jgi:hypothetical protein
MNDISNVSREFFAESSLLQDFEEALVALKVHVLHPHSDARPTGDELERARCVLRDVLQDLDASISPDTVDHVRARSADRIPGAVAVRYQSNPPERLQAVRDELQRVLHQLGTDEVRVDAGGLETLDELASIIDEQRARSFSHMTRRA